MDLNSNGQQSKREQVWSGLIKFATMVRVTTELPLLDIIAVIIGIHGHGETIQNLISTDNNTKIPI